MYHKINNQEITSFDIFSRSNARYEQTE